MLGSSNVSSLQRFLSPTLTFGVAMALAGSACGPADPQPRAEPSSTTVTTAAPTTTTSLAPTSTPTDVLCGTELPVFPTESLVGDMLVDIEGTEGPAEGADPTLANQVVRHWAGDVGITIEIRWPAGPGPLVDSPIVLTQLVDTGSPTPCDVVRVSGYGDEAPLSDVFGRFVDSLDGIDAKPAFLQEQADMITPADAAEPGDCAEPALTTLDANGNPENDAAGDLLVRYANDRTKGSGYEACFTVAGLRQLDALASADGDPDIVRPASTVDLHAEALATYLDANPLRVVRESFEIVAVPTVGGHRLLFGGLTTGPDSNVGEEEAIAFIDEFLLLLADGDHEAAAGYLSNEGVGADVLAAMPTFEDEPAEALRRYCRDALCDVAYKINDTVDFDANSRTIDVTFFGEDDTLEEPMVVGVFEGQLTLLTPPPTTP